MALVDKLSDLYKKAVDSLAEAKDKDKVEQIRIEYLGRKGEFTSILRRVSDLPAEEKPKVGKLANELKRNFEAELNKKLDAIKKEAKALETKPLDVSLPGRRPAFGKKHLVTQIIQEATDIFIGLGYKVAQGPEIETDYYNFTALNTPPGHPARSLQDTFYIQDRPNGTTEELLLRAHTSPVQIRTMEKQKPPLYIIAPGKAYRRDVADPSHTPMFHQIEGLAIDKDLTFGDLKGTLEVLVKEMFGKDRAIRMRPHFFPFTEPSAEVDVSCDICKGQGCRLCGGTGWLEILGCGMVDPNVLKYGGVDSEHYNGFAFGMGVERIAVLRYGLDDIRMLYDNEIRFLGQF